MEKAFNVFLWVVGMGFVFIIVDMVSTKKEVHSGVIVDKQYTAKRTTTGTGIAHTSNGPTVVTTTDTDPEKFLVMVRSESGEILTANCEPELYYQKSIGQTLVYTTNTGRFTGNIWLVNGKN